MCKSKRIPGQLTKAGIDSCKAFVKDITSKRDANASDLSVPLFITEFGACSGSSACNAEMRAVMENSDRLALSWAYYQYKGFDDYSHQYGQPDSLGMYTQGGIVDKDKYYAITRTYPQAVQGTIINLEYNDETGVFIMDYICDLETNAPTVIYINEDEHYPDGYRTSVNFDLADHKINKQIDQTESNWFNVQLATRERDPVFKTVMASVIITR